MNNNYLKFSTFKWFVGIVIPILIIIFGVLGASITKIDIKAEENERGISEVKGDIKAILNDTEWIKKNLNK